jgi:hypothetical protein
LHRHVPARGNAGDGVLFFGIQRRQRVRRMRASDKERKR